MTAPFPPCPEPFNLAEYVLRAGAAQPEKVALSLISDQVVEHWRYADLIAAVRGTATGLLELGLSPGDFVLLRLGNTPDFPVAYLGALAAGLVPVPTAAVLTEPEVSKIIGTLNPSCILRDPSVSCPDGDHIFEITALRQMRGLPPADWHMGDPERLGYIIYTSGTSGRPMAVMHAHRAIWARRMMFDGWYGLRPEDRVLHAGAFNWTYTLGTGLTDPWTLGATALIPAPGTPPKVLPALMAKHEATIFAAAPGVYRQMLVDQPALTLPKLRHGLSAGEKMTSALRAQWEEATGKAVYEAFGMSECSTFISGSPNTPAKDGALGSPQPGRRVEIMGEDGPLPPDTPGTIAIHLSDPGLMLGYFNAPEQTQAKFQGDWFLTGDQGVADARGQITYLGRDDDMMNAGGFRVSPIEVESCVTDAPGIQSVAVTEVEVKPGVNIIAAFYTSETELDADGLSAYVSSRLARYKQPRAWIRRNTLPTGPNGKILRRALRAGYEAKE